MFPKDFEGKKAQNEDEELKKLKDKRDIYTVQNKRKNYLMNKLRIFG